MYLIQDLIMGFHFGHFRVAYIDNSLNIEKAEFVEQFSPLINPCHYKEECDGL